jgi:TonB-dependent receptor
MFPGDTPPEDVPSFAKNVMEDFVWQYAYDNTAKTKGRQIAGQLDFETDFSLAKQLSGKIKFGGKFILNDRSYDLEKYKASITYAGNDYVIPLNEGIEQFKNIPVNTRQHSYDLFIDKNFDHGDFLNGEFKMGPVADVEMMHNIIDLLRKKYHEINNNAVNGFSYLDYSSQIRDYDGDEQLGAGYLMAELNITKKLTFIPGVRYEAKKTTYNSVWGNSDGHVEDKFNSNDTTAVRNNDFWLPMIHLKYEPMDWLQIRAAYTKTVARPNYSALIPSMSISTRNKYLSVKNTQIRPELAESYDISFAFSNNYLGLFTASGFWKNIDDMIFHFSDKVIIDPEAEGFDPMYKGYRYSADMNNETTSISKGFELDWQTNFWYLPSVLKGLVLNVNFTKIFSEALYPNFKVEQVGNFPYTRDSLVNISYTNRLVGQADAIANFAIGWDYKDFSVRVSMNYTTDIFRGHSFYPTYRRYTDAITLWDLRLKQKLPYNLQVYCNISNITNATERTHYTLGYPASYNYYGSRVALGVIWGFGTD